MSPFRRAYDRHVTTWWLAVVTSSIALLAVIAVGLR